MNFLKCGFLIIDYLPNNNNLNQLLIFRDSIFKNWSISNFQASVLRFNNEKIYLKNLTFENTFSSIFFILKLKSFKYLADNFLEFNDIKQLLLVDISFKNATSLKNILISNSKFSFLINIFCIFVERAQSQISGISIYFRNSIEKLLKNIVLKNIFGNFESVGIVSANDKLITNSTVYKKKYFIKNFFSSF